jgi:hypothetical protein
MMVYISRYFQENIMVNGLYVLTVIQIQGTIQYIPVSVAMLTIKLIWMIPIMAYQVMLIIVHPAICATRWETPAAGF